MNVSADLLARLSRPEDADDGDLGALGDLRGPNIVAKLRVVARRCRLVVIDAVQPHPEQVHDS